MAFDEGLAQRVRELIMDVAEFSEKKMFGGICFMVDGNMACGVIGYDVIVRVGPQVLAGRRQQWCRPRS